MSIGHAIVVPHVFPQRAHYAILAATVASALSAALSPPTFAQDVTASADPRLDEVMVVARRREESVQEVVPIPISVVRGELINDAGAFSVNRVKELVPTV